MNEPGSRSRTAERDFEIWQKYTNGQTQDEIASEYRLAQSTVSHIISRMRTDVPIEERRARQRRQLAELDLMRSEALQLIEAPPIPAYSTGRPITMPDGTTAEDHTARVRAMDMLLKVQERESRALGLDSPTKISVDAQALGAEIGELLGELGPSDDQPGA